MLWKAKSKFTLQQCTQPTVRERKNVPSMFQRTLETCMGIVTAVYGAQFTTEQCEMPEVSLLCTWDTPSIYITVFHSVSHRSIPQNKTWLFALTCAHRVILLNVCSLSLKKKKKTWSVSLCFVTLNCLGKQKLLNCFPEVCVSESQKSMFVAPLKKLNLFHVFWSLPTPGEKYLAV